MSRPYRSPYSCLLRRHDSRRVGTRCVSRCRRQCRECRVADALPREGDALRAQRGRPLCERAGQGHRLAEDHPRSRRGECERDCRGLRCSRVEHLEGVHARSRLAVGRLEVEGQAECLVRRRRDAAEIYRRVAAGLDGAVASCSPLIASSTLTVPLPVPRAAGREDRRLDDERGPGGDRPAGAPRFGSSALPAAGSSPGRGSARPCRGSGVEPGVESRACQRTPWTVSRKFSASRLVRR